MSADTIEASEQDSSPRELIDIVHGTVAYRITFADHDLADGTNVYTATPGARGEIGVVGVGNTQKEMTLTLPIDHALARRYLAQGNPPKLITVTVRRKYYPSGDIEQQWVGEITSMGCSDDGTQAVFRVVARAGKALLRVIPNVTAGRTCPHPLYGAMCKISRTGSNPDAIPYRFTTTVMFVSGREVRVDLTNVPAANVNRASWLRAGEFTHSASGEIMTILEQEDLTPGFSTVAKLTLESNVYGMAVGDTVVLQAGCSKEIAMCHSKFGNRQRFGGFNRLPKRQNIHMPQNNGPAVDWLDFNDGEF